jgi:succinate-acetate transporter protein
MVLSTWLLHWWGTSNSVMYFFAFNAALGGVAQFAAGLWSFKARDYIASSLLTMWGTYWMAYGLLVGLSVAGFYKIPPPTAPQPGFAVWFIPLSIFTLCGALAALSPGSGNFPLFLLLFTVGAGSAAVTAGFWMGSTLWETVAAWLFIVGACTAWYVGAMTMLQSSWRRVVLPLGKFKGERAPGTLTEAPTELPEGQPGVRQGQS